MMIMTTALPMFTVNSDKPTALTSTLVPYSMQETLVICNTCGDVTLSKWCWWQCLSTNYK